MSNAIDIPVFYVLDEDKQWARSRIAELEKAILDLGPEFNIALNQSNETWHDNAPFDALRDTQALLVAEMQQLKETLFKAAITTPSAPEGKVGIGSRVTLKRGARIKNYLLAGHWSPAVGHKRGDALVVSCTSPLGRVLLGAKIGQSIVIPTTRREAGVVDRIASNMY